jgi:hypothetical protein
VARRLHRRHARNARRESVDAVVTDPPYGLNFMGKKWDNFTEAELKTGTMLGQQSQNWNESETHSRGYADNNTHAFQAWCRGMGDRGIPAPQTRRTPPRLRRTRTFHRLASGIEDAGFEIRDSIAWLYGSGFPKSLDVGKAIDKGRTSPMPEVGPVAATQGAPAARGGARR